MSASAQTEAASERPPVSRIFFGWFTRAFALFAIVTAFIMPPSGFGVQVCSWQRLFHVPCPGCGLSRSVSSIVHLRFGDALWYHPFGFLVFPLLCAVLVVWFLPERVRARITGWLDARGQRVRRAYYGMIAVFLAFGVVRMALTGLTNGWSTFSG